MSIPYNGYIIEAFKTVFSFYQARITKSGKELWKSDIKQEFVNWDQATKYALGLIDTGEIK